MSVKNNITLGPRALIKTIGSSVGAQVKYYEDGIWYKQNSRGYEGLSEELCSLVLSCSNVEDYVGYKQCMINGKAGCQSTDFTESDEIFLSFQRLFDMYYGGEMEGYLNHFDSPTERIQYTINFVEDCTGLDIRDYLSKTMCLDMLTLNPDRHMHNLGIIADQSSGKFRLAPIFDNGAALLSDLVRFPPDLDVEENISNVFGRPFSANLEYQAAAAGLTLKVDYKMLDSKLSQYPESRALTVLNYQLKKYQSVFAE